MGARTITGSTSRAFMVGKMEVHTSSLTTVHRQQS
nr:MAG TPA: hypothetical protein [Caudoviricetes sp.]